MIKVLRKVVFNTMYRKFCIFKMIYRNSIKFLQKKSYIYLQKSFLSELSERKIHD